MTRFLPVFIAVFFIMSSYADAPSRTTLRGSVVMSGSANSSARTNVSHRPTDMQSQNVRRSTISRSVATDSEAVDDTVGRRNSGVLVARPESVNTVANNGRVVVERSVTRSPVISVSSSSTIATKPTVQETIAMMDSVSEMTEHCKMQYDACMDNFCNVLDDNQGRCTCNKNIKNYEKTENALKNATSELQEVAQRIQYIGLTEKEIVTLFSQTEAETAMQNKSDSSKIKNDLDRIKNMIVGVKSGSASSISETSGISLDLSNLLSFNIDSNGFDLMSMFNTTNTNTSPITNQRGEALYKSATARCKSAVLNSCANNGVDTAMIVNSYDMEIDKSCRLYENYLNESNDQMLSTIRNAKTVLQKARLMVAQQKNQYDLRGCISALDSCMQDDFVCGADYEDCLDPTGKYIVDGEVVVGSMPGIAGGDFGSGSNMTDTPKTGLYDTWNYDGQNIWTTKRSTTPYTMSKYIKDTMSLKSAQNTSATEMAIYLQNKLGYHDDVSGNNYGMCISVLNKCQAYTYNKDKYNAENSVISGFLERALKQIKTSQDKVLQRYAQSCLSDVSSCLNQNNYSYNTASVVSSNPNNIAIKACLPIINTCRSVTLGLSTANVDVGDLSDIYVWLNASIGTTYDTSATSASGSGGSGGGSGSGSQSGQQSTQLQTEQECNAQENKYWYDNKCLSLLSEVTSIPGYSLSTERTSYIPSTYTGGFDEYGCWADLDNFNRVDEFNITFDWGTIAGEWSCTSDTIGNPEEHYRLSSTTIPSNGESSSWLSVLEDSCWSHLNTTYEQSLAADEEAGYAECWCHVTKINDADVGAKTYWVASMRELLGCSRRCPYQCANVVGHYAKQKSLLDKTSN